MNNSKSALRLRIPHVFVTPWMKGSTLQDALELTASKAPVHIQDKVLDALELPPIDVRSPMRAVYLAAGRAANACKKHHLASCFAHSQWEGIEIQAYVEKDI